jgi:hypothetical protein
MGYILSDRVGPKRERGCGQGHDGGIRVGEHDPATTWRWVAQQYRALRQLLEFVLLDH